MKLSTKSTLIVMAAFALGMSACTKENSPAKSTSTTAPSVSYSTVSSQVALNFSNALAGSMGGANLNEGLTPSFLGTYPAGASALCGFVANDNVNYPTDADGIKSVTTGVNKFFFDCLANVPVGYTIADALQTIGTGPGYAFTYTVAQGYQVESLNKTATMLNVDGTLQAYKDVTYTDKAYKPTSEHDAFVILNAGVDISLKGTNSINSGSATFTTQGTNAQGQSWNYTGQMTFIGNDIGKLVFEGNTFYVDLATGKIVTI